LGTLDGANQPAQCGRFVVQRELTNDIGDALLDTPLQRPVALAELAQHASERAL
jgi:hypothetical protein